MQEQNFEKQVREKMEELSFAPSEPVWQRVEEQIRKKKDRRRVLFWLLPFVLVTGGVFTWVNREGFLSVQPTSISKTNTEDQEIIPQQDGLQPATKQGLDKETKGQTIYNEQPVSAPPSGAVTSAPQSSSKPNQKVGLSQSEENLLPKRDAAYKKQNNKPLPKDEVRKNIITSEPSDDRENNHTNIVTKPGETTGNAASETVDKKDENVTDTITATQAINSKDSAEIKTIPVDSLKIAAAKKKTRLQWVFGASAGVSGIATSAFKFLPVASSGVNSDAMSLFDRSLVFNNAVPGNGFSSPAMAVEYNPEVYTGNSFSVGAGIRNGLSPRLDVTAGLHYNYYSTRIYVGKQIDAPTSLNRLNEEVKVNNYFLASASSKEEYANKYHFIALPLGIDWKVNKRLPLQLHSGISISQLVATNALYYSSQQNIYYEDDDVLQKTQFAIFTTLSYRLLQTKAGSLYAGPQLQLGLSNLLQKEAYGKQHLFFAGLNTHFKF